MLQLWRKLFPPVEVHVQVQLPEWINKYPEFAKENELLKSLLSEFHYAYRQAMAHPSFNSFGFYKVAKDTANVLDIPLWKNITPPTGMSLCGGEPLIHHVELDKNRK